MANGSASPTTCGAEWDAAQNQYQDDLEAHQRVVFYASILIGIALMAAGLFLSIPVVDWGLILAGAVQFAIGSTNTGST
jgi:hypothetical protein